MINSRYKVCRNNIYVGQVIKTRHVFRRAYNNNKSDEENLIIQSWRSYRSILFTLTEDNFASDLLYDTPNYPILNFTNDEVCLNFDRDIILIKDIYNLEQLLKYFGYPEELKYEEIKEIRKLFFSSKFARNNCGLFGVKEVYPGEWSYYEGDVKITDPKKLKKFITDERKERLMGNYSFVYAEEGILPIECWENLNEYRDSTFLEVIKGQYERRDSFAPHSHEGKIKRLTKFSK